MFMHVVARVAGPSQELCGPGEGPMEEVALPRSAGGSVVVVMMGFCGVMPHGEQ